MRRSAVVLVLVHVVVVVLGLGALAGAAGADPRKPTFAVDLRSDDVGADKMAAALEDALREAGTAKAAPYRTKTGHAERVAASTDACPSAKEPPCAAEIGAKLGVDYMLYGDVATHGSKFFLTLSIVRVDTRKRVRSLRDVAPRTLAPRAWAKQVFARAVDDAIGSLVIASNVGNAVVYVDGQQATTLYQRRGMVSGLALGRHAVEVRAPGYRPYVDDVVIDGDTMLNVLLDPGP